jgi:hypothetical protein
MPTLPISFAAALEVFDLAMVLLRKRKWFKETVRGAVQGVEFTLGEGSEGYHIHAHLLAWSRWVDWSEFGEQVTDCLSRAAVRLGVHMAFSTSHGRAVVDVRLVTSKSRGKGTVSVRDAVMETCKYIVKGSEYEKIPASEICEVERVLFNRRMVETFGECNLRKGKAVVSETVEKLDDSGKSPYIYKKCTVDGAEKKRSKPLRAIGAELIKLGRRAEWLRKLRLVFFERRQWRKQYLASRFPYATFRTLSGEIFYGLRAQPMAAAA